MKKVLTPLFFVLLINLVSAQNCLLPEITAIVGAEDIICVGEQISLRLEGSINGATSWQWYSDDCGSNTIGSGQSLTISPNASTIFYVRGIGGCALDTSKCTSVTVILHDSIPEISCPLDILVSNDQSSCGAIVTYEVPEGTDICLDVTTTLSSGLGNGSFFPVGETVETYSVTTTAGYSVSCSFTVTVKDDELPTIACPSDIVISNDPGECGAVVIYEIPVGIDNCEGSITTQTEGLGSGSFFPVGETIETYTVSDASGNSESCSFVIIVNDIELPIITVADASIPLWPPNHKHHLINILDYVEMVSDNCPGVGLEDIIIDRVTSDEPQNDKGDGNTLDDILFTDDCQSVSLLAERKGGESRQIGNGRVYTIHLAVSDTSGNVGEASFIAHVPHDMGKNRKVVDNGVAYAQNGCDIEFISIENKENDEDKIDVVNDNSIEVADVTIYPNPFVSDLSIEYVPISSDYIRVSLFNLAGVELRHFFNGSVEANNNYKWDHNMKGLGPGIYLLRIEGDHNSIFKRLIKSI